MKTNKFISPFISCVVQNFPFIEESIDGLTQYDLLCKIVEKLNDVITQTNTQTENIEKLEEAFTTLKNYVDNYFNNLDIQTEINNKLDEMATSGELEAIIASYLNTQAVRGFSTLNDLKNATGLITGAICQTSGKTTYKDGFGSLYRIRNITNEDVIDNDKLVAITSDVSLVAEKITNNVRNTKTTSDTETYSCNYINSLKPSVITVGLTNDTTFTTSNLIVPLDKIVGIAGSKFELIDNKIKIGEGVTKIKVSGSLTEQSTITGLFGCYITKNGPNLDSAINVGYSYLPTTDEMYKISMPPVIVNVNPGDLISLTAYTPIDNAIVTIKGYSGIATNITIEEV